MDMWVNMCVVPMLESYRNLPEVKSKTKYVNFNIIVAYQIGQDLYG